MIFAGDHFRETPRVWVLGTRPRMTGWERVMVSRDGVIAVYIIASRRLGTIYIGVTSDLVRHISEHRDGLIPGFSKTYGCKRLVWHETHQSMLAAIQREKSLKRWPRDWKTNLIERNNPHWRDV